MVAKIPANGADLNGLILSGTTPSLTIGDAGAEDTKIVFDGNAKDFYVALDDSADKLVIGEGSTVGTNSILTITDDSLTIGDASAVDTKIVFDGNAQDFYIGLDDSADDLLIGLGSTVGTTPIISVDENKDVSIPDGGLTITTSDNTDTLTLVSTDADEYSGPNLRLYRNSANPADNDLLAYIDFDGRNDNSQDVTYTQIKNLIKDASDGTEDAQFDITTMQAGASRSRFRTNNTETVLNDDSADIDFRVESDGDDYMLFVDAGSNEVGIGCNPSFSFHHAATANNIIALHHNEASSGNVFGLQIDFSSTVDDNTSYFFRCVGNDRATVRAVIYSDGDIQNADNSYGSTSDERIKEQIKDANSQWDDIKALKIKNYKLKEDVADKGDSDDLWRLGVIAQDLETAGMNGLVKPEVKLDADSPEVVNGKGNVGDIRDYKGVKYSILYMKAVKALQECMARIEALESK